MMMMFVASIIRHKSCIIYAFFYFLFKNHLSLLLLQLPGAQGETCLFFQSYIDKKSFFNGFLSAFDLKDPYFRMTLSGPLRIMRVIHVLQHLHGTQTTVQITTQPPKGPSIKNVPFKGWAGGTIKSIFLFTWVGKWS